MVDDGVLASSGQYIAGDVARNYGILGGVTRPQLESILEHYCIPGVAEALTPETVHVILGLRLDPVEKIIGKALLRHLKLVEISAAEKAASTQAGGDGDNQQDWKALLSSAASPEAAHEIVMKALIHKLGQTNRVSDDVEAVDTSTPLHNYGLDPLLVVGISNWIAKELVVEVESGDILGDGSTLERLSEMIVKRSKLVKA